MLNVYFYRELYILISLFLTGSQEGQPSSSVAFNLSLIKMMISAIVAVSSALAVFAVIGAGFCYHRIRSNSKVFQGKKHLALIGNIKMISNLGQR